MMSWFNFVYIGLLRRNQGAAAACDAAGDDDDKTEQDIAGGR